MFYNEEINTNPPIERMDASMEFSSEEFVARINSTRAGSVWESLDIKLVAATKDEVVATMPIGPNHRQQLGYLHGGISITLAESLASLGSVLNVDLSHQMVFGLEINASHLRSKREGMVTGTATLLRRGRTAHVWDVRITDEEGKLICISRCTIAVVEHAPDSANPLFAVQ